MKKIDLGQSVAILANLGVITGIVFLGLELRQNTSAVESTANQALAEQMQSALATMDRETLGLIVRGEFDSASLNPFERMELTYTYLGTYIFFQNLYFQVQSGALNEATVAGWWQFLRHTLETEVGGLVWEQIGYMFSDEFTEFVEEEVLTLELEGRPPWALRIE